MVRSTRKLAASVAKALTRTGRREPGTPEQADRADAPNAATETPEKEPAKQAAATASPATKAPAKAPATKASATKASATKASATKASAKKATVKKASAKKATVKKASAKKASATKAPATKAPVEKTPAAPSAATKATATKATAKRAPATKAPARKAPVKKTPAAPSAATKARATTVPASALVVLEGEAGWTDSELADVLRELHEQRDHSGQLVSEKDAELADLMRDSGDGAGLDQADVGASQFERDQELTVLGNERDKLAQVERALARIDDGSYGVCESCGRPVGKNRLMAFPRATLCMTCKQREERR